jgi:hypothetical protein
MGQPFSNPLFGNIGQLINGLISSSVLDVGNDQKSDKVKVPIPAIGMPPLSRPQLPQLPANPTINTGVSLNTNLNGPLGLAGLLLRGASNPNGQMLPPIYALSPPGSLAYNPNPASGYIMPSTPLPYEAYTIQQLENSKPAKPTALKPPVSLPLLLPQLPQLPQARPISVLDQVQIGGLIGSLLLTAATRGNSMDNPELCKQRQQAINQLMSQGYGANSAYSQYLSQILQGAYMPPTYTPVYSTTTTGYSNQPYMTTATPGYTATYPRPSSAYYSSQPYTTTPGYSVNMPAYTTPAANSYSNLCTKRPQLHIYFKDNGYHFSSKSTSDRFDYAEGQIYCRRMCMEIATIDNDEAISFMSDMMSRDAIVDSIWVANPSGFGSNNSCRSFFKAFSPDSP